MCVCVAATALTDLDSPTINKLLTALNECTEWGQVFILDSLASYEVRLMIHTHHYQGRCFSSYIYLHMYAIVSFGQITHSLTHAAEGRPRGPEYL